MAERLEIGYQVSMRSRKPAPSLAEHGPVVNTVLLGLSMTICAIGAWSGMDAVRRNQPADFMGPAWFVASALGFVVTAGLAVALLVCMIQDSSGGGAATERP
jgi:hypothetical protein